MSSHIRKHRSVVSNYRPIGLAHPYWIQDEKLSLPQCFHFARFGDLDGDGELEMIVCKGAGEQYACKLNGKIIWHYIDEEANGWSVRVDSKLPLYDINDDGNLELVCVRELGGQAHYCVLDAATGKVKHKHTIARSEKDSHLSIIPAWLDGPNASPSLVVTRDYWRIEVYSNELKPRWVKNIPELGHTTVAQDIDGDGREELYVGTRLFTADGEILWSKPELLDGTGESHPDSIHIADIDGDGELEMLFGPAGQVLDTAGNIRWKLNANLTEVQSIRLLQRGDKYRVCFTDLPFSGGKGGHLTWRGFKLRDVRSHSVITDCNGEVLAEFDGLHTPAVGDWDGDGVEELFNLNRSGDVMEIRNQDGVLIDRFDIQKRIYISDMMIAPCLREANGSQFMIHEWNEEFTCTECVIYENTQARDRGIPFNQLWMARHTVY